LPPPYICFPITTLSVNLIIDIGNSRVKSALFQKGQLIRQQMHECFDPARIAALWEREEPEKAIISNVGKEVEWPNGWDFPFIELGASTPLPFSNKYKSPATLGRDRLALTAAAVLKFPGQNCLVIDTGTCITYDFVDRHAVYHGGGISPGLQMRLRSLNHYTSRLPLVNYQQNFDPIIGDTTDNSILSGTVGGFKREVYATIVAYQERYPDILTMITGGDAYMFDDLLKNSIFAAPDFLMTGLNHILDYNAERL